MKKIFMMLLILGVAIIPNFVYAISSAKLNTTTVEYYMKKPPGEVRYCPDDGTGCKVTKTSEPLTTVIINVTPHLTSGYLITFIDPFVTVTYDNGNGDETFSSTDKSWNYTSASVLTLTNVDNYPALNNTVINLNGQTANSTGQVTVWYIP
ncbi:MAG: hypothetical protein ACOVNU_13000 [Candidatus Kapaibacteriota bacterium]